ncbi:hypothetical protein CYMTET_10414 [Cymbomonas tetramitiformis]|uniref:Uncharacterized protein n=1 Tax=Cymbomonas tetramitiformis TaxID=36881 RepID=A0AAE0GPG1_9CHLO|nr:hypothetical protein CYMTET_10414 [Cymbomonas tetramitiformis]
MGSGAVGETGVGGPAVAEGVLVILLGAAGGGIEGELVGAPVVPFSPRLMGPSYRHLLGVAERIDRGLLFHRPGVFSDGVAVQTGQRKSASSASCVLTVVICWVKQSELEVEVSSATSGED